MGSLHNSKLRDSTLAGTVRVLSAFVTIDRSLIKIDPLATFSSFIGIFVGVDGTVGRSQPRSQRAPFIRLDLRKDSHAAKLVLEVDSFLHCLPGSTQRETKLPSVLFKDIIVVAIDPTSARQQPGGARRVEWRGGRDPALRGISRQHRNIDDWNVWIVPVPGTKFVGQSTS